MYLPRRRARKEICSGFGKNIYFLCVYRIILNSILALLWVELLHMSKLIAPIINLLVSVPINFFMNKFWAFKKKPSEGRTMKTKKCITILSYIYIALPVLIFFLGVDEVLLRIARMLDDTVRLLEGFGGGAGSLVSGLQ